ncbi:hypothetical protein HCH52_01340 [Oscillospiraceae bacterium HV4-5-C5C]|nr:hypothetical protein [Oscillospiraceae bacterium HV4-5-C5C]
MPDHLAICLFAKHYARLFSAAETHIADLTKSFDTQCEQLGFKMDHGQAFISQWSRAAFYQASALEPLLPRLSDWQQLGSAVYSHWYGVTFWQRESLLAQGERDWFILALNRLAQLGLAELTYPLAFQGSLRSFTLRTYHRDENPFMTHDHTGREAPAADLSVQQLQIDDEGHVTFIQPEASAAIKMNLSAENTRQLMEALAAFFGDADPTDLASMLEHTAADPADLVDLTEITDEQGKKLLLRQQVRPGSVGQLEPRPVASQGWELVLINSADQSYCYEGMLADDLFIFDDELSQVLRHTLDRDDLWAFDGNPDRIFSLSFYYHRVIALPPAEAVSNHAVSSTRPVQAERQNSLSASDRKTAETARTYLDIQEQLSLNVQDSRLAYSRQIGKTGRVSCTLEIPWRIRSFLESLNPVDFVRIPGKPADAQPDPMDLKVYKMHLYSFQGWTCTLTGSYDRCSLPENWPQFIKALFELLETYLVGDLFDPQLFDSALKRQSDLAFYFVSFDLSATDRTGRTYCYLAGNEVYRPGDRVLVPAGPDNHETVARVVRVEYHQPEDAPYPLKKLKQILRKYSS